MTRRNVALVICAAAIALASGCASGPPVVEAQSSQKVALAADVERTRVTSKVAEELTLELPPVEQPNYHWRLFFHDPRALRQTSNITAGPTEASRATVTFVAQRAVSRTLLRFMLVRDANAREDEPIAAHEVIVTIQP